MLDYIVFFGLIFIGLLCWIRYEYLTKKAGYSFAEDHQRIKLESPIERCLYDALKRRGEVVQSQVPCGKYRIDLTLPAYRIAIECDGKAFHSSPMQKAHDKRKNIYLKKHGWIVLRFSGRAIYRNMNGVLRRIDNYKTKNNYYFR